MKPTSLADGHGSIYKEVRFSPTETRVRRTKSVSATFPPVISGYGRTASQDSALVNPCPMDTSFIDEWRALLQNQRLNFETERALFAQERCLWEKERALLQSKIAELESFVKKNQGKRSVQLGSEAARLVLESSQFNTNGLTAQVWEGPSPGTRPTRVFFDHDSPDQSYLSPTSESGLNPPSLDQALSPHAQLVDPSGAPVSLPVPIEKLDSTLDGITLKSTALPPGVVARVITPPSPSPLVTSPGNAPSTAARPTMEHRNSLKLKLSELGPPNERLLRDAGHTPMAIIEGDDSRRSTKDGSPMEEPLSLTEDAPFAPVATNAQQPAENNISYFPDVPEDPALKGPLGLINDEEHDSNFLQELDQKLLDQAKNVLGGSGESADPNASDSESEFPDQGETEPEFKFKKSSNFGSAFGESNIGQI
ncbi:uncharacterized protein N7515_000546 [Penicillium bovifimosum]|uniref:Uncharacterized protein n=1 Tax=Penicillium bovifimosum TaxID=126998 RepID=A0A9W9HIE0_9EURO|nr:uncharacterized protein N7515_000546 [Penicillium bovifimosum]KAJ5145982.1 hypothetical protein N7515_000546 [Penicillium bovifimosum]